MTGLHISITQDGGIKKHLSTQNGEVQLPETTISEELIQLTDDSFPWITTSYRNIYTTAILVTNHRQDYSAFCKNVDDFLSEQDTGDPVYSTLTRLSISDKVRDFRNPSNLTHTASETLRVLLIPITIQRATKSLLDALCDSLPIEELPDFQLMKNTHTTTVFSFSDTLSAEYIFRGFEQYYCFLLQHFIVSKHNIKKCQYCGGYFIPKNKRNTKYCDRVIRDGKTCKEIAPQLKHRERVAANRVLSELDRVGRMLYSRLNRTGDDKEPSIIDITDAEYQVWINTATDAKKRYLAGELSEDEAIALIYVPKKDEMLENNSAEYTLANSIT